MACSPGTERSDYVTCVAGAGIKSASWRSARERKKTREARKALSLHLSRAPLKTRALPLSAGYDYATFEYEISLISAALSRLACERAPRWVIGRKKSASRARTEASAASAASRCGLGRRTTTVSSPVWDSSELFNFAQQLTHRTHTFTHFSRLVFLYFSAMSSKGFCLRDLRKR